MLRELPQIAERRMVLRRFLSKFNGHQRSRKRKCVESIDRPDDTTSRLADVTSQPLGEVIAAGDEVPLPTKNSFAMSNLFGPTLTSHYGQVDSDSVLEHYSTVLVFFGNGDTKSVDLLKRYHRTLPMPSDMAIVYCCVCGVGKHIGFDRMPRGWFAVNNRLSLIDSLFVEELSLFWINRDKGKVIGEVLLDDVHSLAPAVDIGAWACDLSSSRNVGKKHGRSV